jgi:glycosyltransferase involved in cell wall biosynthesis
MPTKDQFPRVLMVLMTKVKADDPVNLLIRAQFGNWEKESLSQIHACGETSGHDEFCGSYYRLQACDRFLGGLFQRLRGDVMEMVAADPVVGVRKDKPKGVLHGWTKSIKKRLGDWLIGSGFWEVIFHVQLSRRMEQFVERFKPDLIYCQGYSLGFATLPLLIAKRFGIPICFQTTDDWPSYTYRGSPMGWLLRRRAWQLVTQSKVRLAFGEKMRHCFESRYGLHFETAYHLDDPRRFPEGSTNGTGPFRIVYTGSIGMRRYEAIQDLLHVVRSFQDHTASIQIMVYCPGLPKDTPQELFDSPEVKLLPLPKHDELPSILASASILFLPESFNVAPELIEYAISSKAHLYMMSGRPILAYGPIYSGTLEYALQGGWAAVVTDRNQDALKSSLWKLLNDRTWKADLGRKAVTCINNNHDLLEGRETFRMLLANAV